MFLLSGAVAAGAATPLRRTASVLDRQQLRDRHEREPEGRRRRPLHRLARRRVGQRASGPASCKSDLPSGATDDSFGQGTKENDANPTIVDGSIPPNKSDLKTFGALHRRPRSPKFLELFWTRVQNPTGTTNMDFELNQKFCDPSATPTNCSNNGVTPVRTLGDKLITYDLANGGTVPTISIRTWIGSVWGPPTDHDGPGHALGSINTSAIAATDSGGLGALERVHLRRGGDLLRRALPELAPAVRRARLGLRQEPFVRLVHGRAQGLHRSRAGQPSATARR